MGSWINQNPSARSQFHNYAAQSADLPSPPPTYGAWLPNNEFEMHAFGSRPTQHSRPAQSTRSANTQRPIYPTQNLRSTQNTQDSRSPQNAQASRSTQNPRSARPAQTTRSVYPGQYLPGPATLPPRVQRTRGGGLSCCALLTIIGGGLLLIAAIGAGVGVGIARSHDNNGGGGGSSGGNGGGVSPTPTGGGNSPTPTGGGITPTPTGGVTGGPSGTALSNANLAAITLHGCSPDDFNAEFSIGGQPFMLTIDSGSSTTAVAGNQCNDCDVSPEYSPGNGAQTNGQLTKSSFGDGSGWIGQIYTDSVVAGTTSNNVTSPVTMNFVAIQSQSDFFHPADCSASGNSANSDVQGILGIGPQSLELPGTDDFAAKLSLVSGLPNAYAFMACDSSSQGSGFMTFGGYHPDLVAQDPVFVPMSDLSGTFPYYGVNVDAVGLGGTKVVTSIGNAVVDTGTSQFLLPTSAFNAFLSGLGSNSAFTKQFSSLLKSTNACFAPAGGLTRAQVDAQLPQLNIDIDTGSGSAITLTLPASQSYLMPMSKDPSGTSAALYCLGVGDAGAQGPTIIGNSVMRGAMVVFDIGNQQIGFARSKGCPSALT